MPEEPLHYREMMHLVLQLSCPGKLSGAPVAHRPHSVASGVPPAQNSNIFRYVRNYD
jgi:hypothetical protein